MKHYIVFFMLIFIITNHISAQIPNIKLVTTQNKNINLTELIGRNSLNVLMFYSPECPICQRNTLNIRQLSAKYTANKVNFVLIYPASFDKRKILKRFQKKYQMTSITGILDKENQLVNLLNAQITPEYFLLNTQGKTLYSGALDNAFVEIGKKRTVVTQFYLDDAIQQSIDNKEIVIKKTEAVGCFIRK